MVAVGAAAAQAIRAIRADVYFIGVTGTIHAEFGLSTGDSEEAVIERAIADCAAAVVVMTSREKIGAAPPFFILPASAVTRLLVPESVVAPSLKPLRRRGIEIIRVPVSR